MSFTGKSDLQLCPNIITEIEAMETDFNLFLEKLYK